MYTEISTPVPAGTLTHRVYAGEIFLFRDLPAMQELVRFTRQMLEHAFAPVDPPQIHLQRTRAEQASQFARLSQEYSGSATVKGLWLRVFESLGLDPDNVARDRLRLRFQPPVEASLPTDAPHLTVPFHRDTWGTNLYAQVNWWAPVYPLEAGRTMALYPQLWNRPLRNSSAQFDLQSIVDIAAERGRAAITGNMAVPQLLEAVDAALAQPVVIEPGSVVMFSSAHAHAGVPNSTAYTRLSIETRTVWIPDVVTGAGAPNIDGVARWMAPGFFYRLSDAKPLNEILGQRRLEPFNP